MNSGVFSISRTSFNIESSSPQRNICFPNAASAVRTFSPMHRASLPFGPMLVLFLAHAKCDNNNSTINTYARSLARARVHRREFCLHLVIAFRSSVLFVVRVSECVCACFLKCCAARSKHARSARTITCWRIQRRSERDQGNDIIIIVTTLNAVYHIRHQLHQ